MKWFSNPLTGDKFMSELHFRQPGLTYSYTNHRKRIQKLKKTGDLNYI